MEHLIRFKTAEGIDGTHMADDLDQAVGFAERVRNTEEATDVRLYRLTEVPIEFKPYYRLEVGSAETGEEPPAPWEQTHLHPVSAIDASAHGDDGGGDHAGESANGRRLFSRTL